MSSPRPIRPRLALLGPVQATREGSPVPVRGRKQHILLSRLALAGSRPVSVETLIDDLWGSTPPADAGGALQVHVSRLRSALAVEIELVNATAYRLAAGQATTDVAEFTDLCDRARATRAAGDGAGAVALLEQALGLWRGPALGDLGRDNALRASALRLDEGRDRAVDEWVDVCLEVGRADEVIGELRSALDLDPLQERRWRQLIQALHRCGRHGEALAAYQRAREVFIDELGVEPSQMLSDVHSELQRLDGSGSAPGGQVPDFSASGLIGRANELEVLTEAWLDGHDRLRVVTLSGEAGVGKSRLAEEFAAGVSASGGTVLVGRCDPAVASPFQPFAQILGAHFDELLSRPGPVPVDPRLVRYLPGLVRVAPELLGVLPTETYRPTTPTPDDRGHGAYEAVAAWLSQISESAPVLIVLDDLHWADPETLHQLRHVLHSPRPVRALIVVALRDREVSSDPAAGPVPATVFPELLRQSDRLSHLPLRRLDADETAALLARESADRAPLSGPVVDHVHAASGGNPLFIVELARQLRASATGSSSSLSPSGTPAGLRHVIADRVALLPPPTRTMLRWASVVGAEWEVSVLARLARRGVGEGDDDEAPISATDIDAAARTAVHAQLIEPVGDSGRFTFSHEIVRTTLYDSSATGELAVLHGAIADILEGERWRDPAARHHVLAHHLRRSDLPEGPVRAARHLLAAGRDALDRGASDNALQVLSDALELPLDDDGLRCDLLTELGTAQLRNARPEHRSTLLEAADLAHSLPDRDRLIAAVLANTRGWFSDSMAVDHDRVAGIETALAMCDADDAEVRAPLLAAWAMENARDPGIRDEVLSASAEAVRLAEGLGDDAVLTMTLARRYTVLYALFEQPAECLRVAQRLLDLARATGDRWIRLTSSICLAQASMRFGGFQVADRHMTQAAQLARTLERPAQQWLVAGWQATRAGMRGHLDRAEDLVRANLELGLRSNQVDATTWFLGQLFTIRLLQDRLPEMLVDVTDQVATAAEAIPAWRAAMAVVLAHSGGRADAERILDELAADSFTALPRDIVWLNGMSYLAMACEAVQRPDIAGRLYPVLAPFSGMVATNGTIDSGPVDLHLGALARLSGDTDLARQHLESAEVLCRRIDAPAWGARATRLLETL